MLPLLPRGLTNRRRLAFDQQEILLLAEAGHFLCQLAHYYIQVALQLVISVLYLESLRFGVQDLFEQTLQVNRLEVLLDEEHDGEVVGKKFDALLIVTDI